jgi:hypothetical protein
MHKAVSGQWLLNCSGCAFLEKETRFVANIFGCKISANKTRSLLAQKIYSLEALNNQKVYFAMCFVCVNPNHCALCMSTIVLCVFKSTGHSIGRNS